MNTKQRSQGHMQPIKRKRRAPDEAMQSGGVRGEIASPAQSLDLLRTPQVGRVARGAAVVGLQGAVGNGAVGREIGAIQRKEASASINDKQIETAVAWAIEEQLGEEAIRQLQRTLGISPSGIYDRSTALSVYQKQREWKKKGQIPNAGKSTSDVFSRLGLILTHTIASARVNDAELAAIKKDFPTGLTVAIYAQYDYGDAATRQNNAEFERKASEFAKNQLVVGLSGGDVVRGQPIPVRDVGQVIEVVQSIHHGLVKQYQHSLPPSQPTDRLPAFTQIKNLALFAHGEPFGVGLNEKNKFTLRAQQKGLYPPTVHSFVQGLSGAVAANVSVQLFACSAAREPTKTKETFEDWQDHTQGKRRGADSFAAKLAQELGPEASVFGHTTAGHTTENYAATAFGKAAGGGEGGLHMFDLMYPTAFVQAEVIRLFPDLSEIEQTNLFSKLRDEMWSHFKDSIVGEAKGRMVSDPKDPTKKVRSFRTRYATGTPPLGQEMFVNPDSARELLHQNWSTLWMTQEKRDGLRPRLKSKKAQKK